MRFFTPNEKFFSWIERVVKDWPNGRPIVVDVGCGQGELVRELIQKKIPTIGVDPRFSLFSDEQIPHDLISNIYPMEVQGFGLVQTNPTILLTCRPCHNGFVKELNQIRHTRSALYYVGLQKNLDRDLSGLDFIDVGAGIVGLEDERIWKIL